MTKMAAPCKVEITTPFQTFPVSDAWEKYRLGVWTAMKRDQAQCEKEAPTVGNNLPPTEPEFCRPHTKETGVVPCCGKPAMRNVV